MPVENQTYSSNRNPFNYVKIEQVDRDYVTAWLTLDEITNQLNLFDDESQDAYLSSLELATRFAIEDYLGMSIFSLTYRVWYGAQGTITAPMAVVLVRMTALARSGVTPRRAIRV